MLILAALPGIPLRNGFGRKWQFEISGRLPEKSFFFAEKKSSRLCAFANCALKCNLSACAFFIKCKVRKGAKTQRLVNFNFQKNKITQKK